MNLSNQNICNINSTMIQKVLISVIICTFIIGGLCAQDSQKERLIITQVEQIPNNEKVSDIIIKGNKVWIAGSGGVVTLDRNGNDARVNELKKGEAKAIKLSSNDELLSGFANNMLYINDYRLFHISSDTVIINDIEEYDNKMYVATNDGLLVFDLKRRVMHETIDIYNSKLKSNMINFVYADEKDRLWVGTEKGIMYKKGPDKNWSQNYDADLDYITIAENKEGVWLISDKKMWLVNSTDDQWIDAGLNYGLHKGKVNDLVVDNEGQIFIASDILVKFDPYKNRTESYSDVLGIASKKCLALECDDNNVIWLGTEDAGLFKISKSSEPVQVGSLIIAGILEKSITCAGKADAALKISVEGGSPPYAYSWNPVFVSGDNPSKLKAGEYVLTVTDSRGNSNVSNYTINEPEQISIQIETSKRASSATERDGAATLAIVGGTSPYEIKWDNGETGFEAKKLNYGYNYVKITDSNGCSTEDKIKIDRESSIASFNTKREYKVGEKLRIDNIYFKADSSAVEDKSLDALEDIFIFLDENKDLIIEIGGHTNGIPPHEYCDKLSEERAKSVAEYLTRRGIDEERVKYKGYGKREPIATNDTNEGRKKNQRVELKILAVTN